MPGKGLDKGRKLRQHLSSGYSETLLQEWVSVGTGSCTGTHGWATHCKRSPAARGEFSQHWPGDSASCGGASLAEAQGSLMRSSSERRVRKASGPSVRGPRELGGAQRKRPRTKC